MWFGKLLFQKSTPSHRCPSTRSFSLNTTPPTPRFQTLSRLLPLPHRSFLRMRWGTGAGPVPEPPGERPVRPRPTCCFAASAASRKLEDELNLRSCYCLQR